jgi:hypothetical protein
MFCQPGDLKQPTGETLRIAGARRTAIFSSDGCQEKQRTAGFGQEETKRPRRTKRIEWQVIDQIPVDRPFWSSGRSSARAAGAGFEPAATTVGWLTAVGREISLNGGFLIS